MKIKSGRYINKFGIIILAIVMSSCLQKKNADSLNYKYITLDSLLQIEAWNVSFKDSLIILTSSFNQLPDSFLIKKEFPDANVLGLEYYFDANCNSDTNGGDLYITYDVQLPEFNDSLLLATSSSIVDSSIIYLYQLAHDKSEYSMSGPYGNTQEISNYRLSDKSNIYNYRVFRNDTLTLMLNLDELFKRFEPFDEGAEVGIRLRSNLKDNYSRFGSDKNIIILDKKP